MSEQDFFFDEEPEAKAPAAKTPKAPKASAPAPSKSSPAEPVVEASVADGTTTWAVAALIGVIGLLLGAILGFVLGNTLAGASASSGTSTTGAPTPITGTQPAPQLTTEQISAGQLPAGHPAINTSGAAETSAAK